MSFYYKTIIQSLSIIIFLIIAIAFVTLLERKILAVIQRRQGPNVIGPFGLLQPIIDGFKLLMKEPILPNNADKVLFAMAPVISFLVSLLGWGVIPFSHKAVFANVDLGLLHILSVYGIIISVWSSNSKYVSRSSAQMISYELPIGFTILNVALLAGSLNINYIIIAQKCIWCFVPLFSIFLVFFISGLAETNRHPFYLAEAKSASDYNVEYSVIEFTLCFL